MSSLLVFCLVLAEGFVPQQLHSTGVAARRSSLNIQMAASPAAGLVAVSFNGKTVNVAPGSPLSDAAAKSKVRVRCAPLATMEIRTPADAHVASRQAPSLDPTPSPAICSR
jgi:hypothetical protein